MYDKTTLLNGVIEEEVYIEKPRRFETHERHTHLCRLKKAIYGSSRLPRHDTTGLKTTFNIWDLLRVTQIPTFTM